MKGSHTPHFIPSAHAGSREFTPPGTGKNRGCCFLPFRKHLHFLNNIYCRHTVWKNFKRAQSALNHHCLSTVLLNVAFKSKVFLSFFLFLQQSVSSARWYIYEQLDVCGRIAMQQRARMIVMALGGLRLVIASEQPALFCEKDPLMCNARWCLNPRANFGPVTQGS